MSPIGQEIILLKSNYSYYLFPCALFNGTKSCQVPSNYAGQLSPSSKGSEAVPVYLNISILALPRIDTILLAFTVDYYVNLRW